jgi:hypothetical protein
MTATPAIPDREGSHFYPRALQSMDLSALAMQVAQDAQDHRDFIADTRKITVLPKGLDDPGEPGAELHIDGQGEFGITPFAHRQIAARLGVPAKFYDRMLADYPDQYAGVVNAIMRREPEKRMVRTLRGDARAYLSNGYKIRDNYALMEHIMPVLGAIPDVQFPRCSITDTRLYITAINPNVEREIKVGDGGHCAGIRITNSEVGNGSLSVFPVVWTRVCTNGMVRESFGQRHYHIGGRIGDNDNEDAFEVFSDATRELDDKAFFAKVGDVVKAAVSDHLFDQIIDQLRNAADQHIEGDPVAAVEEVQNTFDLTDDERGGVMRHLIEGGDLSMWGVVSAVTRTAQDVADFDRAMDLERVGGKIVELPAGDWRRIATAGAAS